MTNGWWLLLAVVVLAPVGALYLRRRLARAPADLPACARCGYIVVGLPTSICPECGADINRIGVRRPSFWVRLSPTRRLIFLFLAWTGWVSGAWYVAWTPIRFFLAPVTWTMTEGVSFRLQPSYTTFLTLTRRSQVTGTLTTYPWAGPSLIRTDGWLLSIGAQPDPFHHGPCICDLIFARKPLTVETTSFFGVCHLHNRYGTGTNRSTRLAMSDRPFTPGDLSTWLASLPESQRTPTLSPDVQKTYQAVINAPHRAMKLSVPFKNSLGMELRGSGSSAGPSNERWARASRGSALAIWILGTIVIMNRWRKLRRTYPQRV